MLVFSIRTEGTLQTCCLVTGHAASRLLVGGLAARVAALCYNKDLNTKQEPDAGRWFVPQNQSSHEDNFLFLHMNE